MFVMICYHNITKSIYMYKPKLLPYVGGVIVSQGKVTHLKLRAGKLGTLSSSYFTQDWDSGRCGPVLEPNLGQRIDP